MYLYILPFFQSKVTRLSLRLELAADPVIEAIARLAFKDRRPPWRLQVPMWLSHQAQNQFQTPLGVRIGPKGSVVISFRP